MWMAVIEDGVFCRLENGRSRQQVRDELIRLRSGTGRLVVGIDFAFGFPRCVVPYELRNAREPPNLRGHWLISTKEPGATYLADPGGRAGRRAPGYRLARLAWLLWAGAGQRSWPAR
jgi:hypothetical protein